MLVELLQSDIVYPAGSTVLEAGCGVGAQTVPLAARSPGAHFTSVDVSGPSVAEAQRRVSDAGLGNVRLQQADIFDLPFGPGSFDHVFVCFVLEHLPDPGAALRALRPLIRPGGTITVIEGDHGSAFFHPDDADARKAIRCLTRLQADAGGDALVGRRVHPLLVAAGFDRVAVSPRLVYVDADRPDLVEGFTRRTFTAMVAGIRDAAVERGLVDEERFDVGIRALERTTEPDGVFVYTFFRGLGHVDPPAARSAG